MHSLTYSRLSGAALPVTQARIHAHPEAGATARPRLSSAADRRSSSARATHPLGRSAGCSPALGKSVVVVTVVLRVVSTLVVVVDATLP